MSEGRLAGKVAIVTGGGSRGGELGTGEATAICLAREGASVVVADIAAENAERTVAAIASEGGEASTFIGDGCQSDASSSMIDAAVERYGGLHVLMNNLGYRSQAKTRGRGVDGLVEEQFDAAVALNLKTATLASKYAIPAMKANGGGSIINVSSVDGLAAGHSYGVPYGVTKGALHMLTISTAAYHGRDGIRANCIAPGHLHSSFTSAIDPKLRDLRRRVVPLGTEGTPWDVGWLAVFLASDESKWISGVTIPVDGGLFAAQPLVAHRYMEADGEESEAGSG
jgi:NAD(P)-dependent dehydrogenase (short-subunit alcohol dehydrogenase family)